jgi:hypothetical protein
MRASLAFSVEDGALIIVASTIVPVANFSSSYAPEFPPTIDGKYGDITRTLARLERVLQAIDATITRESTRLNYVERWRC